MTKRDLIKKFSESKTVLSLLVSATGAILICIVIAANAVSTIDRPVLDFLFRHASHPERADTSVVIATIDQKSLAFFDSQHVGWPWPREFYSIVLDYFRAGGVKAVAFDMDFSQRDMDRLNVDARESDSIFAESIGKCGNVVLTTVLVEGDSNGTGSGTPLDRFYMSGKFDKMRIPLFNSCIVPVEDFARNARMLGVSNYRPDVDGMTRRIPLLFGYRGALLPQLAFATFAVGREMSRDSLASFAATIPVDNTGHFLINWYGRGGPDGVFKYYSISALIVSAAQLVEGRQPEVSPSAFRDKYVIVGGSAIGLMDFKSTPFTILEPYPGMEIHATILSNLLRMDYMREAPPWVSYSISICFVFLISILFFRIGKVFTMTAVVLAVATAYMILIWFSFYSLRLLLPVGAPELAIVLGFTFSGAVSFVTEGRRRRELRRVLNRYLSPRVVDEILVDPDDFELGGREMDATVFFSDIRNFTGLSEKMSPKELVSNLNEYFTIASEIILEHDAMLDKYIGDAIMAIFGAPLQSDKHAVNACLAAIQAQDILGKHYSVNDHGNRTAFETRIGLNSGKMVIGNIGSLKRLDYTAIGDSVNLASRLEGVNKEFGTQIIISESTYELARDEVEARELDFLRVKGKQLPIRIYELLGRKDEISPEKRDLLEQFVEGLNSYRSRKWKKAQRIFLSILEKDPSDTPSRTYLSRCQLLAKVGVPDDWDGIYVMTTK
ncbi:MAG TPA: adenylate/guanylate cyclase domain-containing protein [Candidatus Kryptonia bacterium]